MSFKDDPFQRFSHFDPESRLSEFRKRFEDLAQNNNKRSNMFFDSRHPNGWPLHHRRHNGIYDMAKNGNINNMTANREEEGIPIKVFHETSNETEMPSNEERSERNSDSVSSNGSTQSHKSAEQSCQSSHSTSSGNSGHSSGSVFHSSGPQSQPSTEPRVHHIPIQVEPRDGSTSSGYTSEPNANPAEQPLSRSSSNSSRHSVQSGESHATAHKARSPSPAKSVSSNHSNASSNSSNNAKPRVCQIPVTVETNESQTHQKPRPPLIDNNMPKAKSNGLGQSRVKTTKKSGPFVTRIPVVGESNTSSPAQTSASHSQPLQQNIKCDALTTINKVLNDLQKYEIEVNEFNGTPDDKRYRYLDEMLTRLIIKLDTIETEGKEDVRKARKAAIIAVNKCINLLESKMRNEANNATHEVNSDEPMVVSTPEPTTDSNLKEVENKNQNEDNVEEMQVEEQRVSNSDSHEKDVNHQSSANQMTDNKVTVNVENKESCGKGERKETAV